MSMLAIPLLLLSAIVLGFFCYVAGNMRGYREGVEHRVDSTAEDIQ